MKQIKWVAVILLVAGVAACNNKVNNEKGNNMKQMESKLATNNKAVSTTDRVVKTDEEWKKELTPEQFYILRQKGTERPFTGKLLNHKEDGLYTCAACGNELFKSDQKFDSHCGWPSFDDQIEGAINTHRDTSHGMIRTEITCARCDGHLGHIFDDGPTETGLRYCVNSISIGFKKDTTDK
jgi:peptide-methionine (R)-S-oxide reductase